MANNNNNVTYGGVGFLGLLTLIFITLKLLGVITWGWAWVLAPIWIPALIGAIGVLVFVVLIELWG